MDSKAASALKDNFAKPQEINASNISQGGLDQGDWWSRMTSWGQWELILNFLEKPKKMVAFFEADGGVWISYKHLVNLNPQTTDVMAVACSVTPNSSSRNHGSVENGSQYQVPFIEIFHFTMILGFLGAHPPMPPLPPRNTAFTRRA